MKIYLYLKSVKKLSKIRFGVLFHGYMGTMYHLSGF